MNFQELCQYPRALFSVFCVLNFKDLDLYPWALCSGQREMFSSTHTCGTSAWASAPSYGWVTFLKLSSSSAFGMDGHMLNTPKLFALSFPNFMSDKWFFALAALVCYLISCLKPVFTSPIIFHRPDSLAFKHSSIKALARHFSWQLPLHGQVLYFGICCICSLSC